MPGVVTHPSQSSSSMASNVARKIPSSPPYIHQEMSGSGWPYDDSPASGRSRQPVASSSRTAPHIPNATTIAADGFPPALSNSGLFLAPEIDEEEAYNSFLDVPDLVEYIFPDHIFPPQVNMDSLVKALMLPESELWDSAHRIWRGCPLLNRFDHVLPDQRDAMPAFLNRITQRIYEACHANRCNPMPHPRKWTSKFSAQNVSRGRAPDMCLVEQRFPTQWIDPKGKGPSDDGYTWKQVISCGLDLVEFSPARMVENLECGAYWQFTAQPTRRFSISVSFHSDGVRVHVLDCAGIVSSEPIDIHQEPARFVRLLAGMALVNDAHMGSDTSITSDMRVQIAGETYLLQDRLYVTPGYIGPRTLVWRAVRQSTGETVVIKDIWEDSEASFLNEAEMMLLVQDVEGVAQLIGSEGVAFHGRNDTTAHIRRAVKEGHKHFHRLIASISLYTHRRLVITPFAADLRHFRTKQELLYIFIDVVQTIERLGKRRIMHSDISIGNVRIYDPNLTPTKSTLSGSVHDRTLAQRRRGILIDLDNALQFDENWNICSRPQEYANPGTTPFNSTELILNGPEGRRLIRYDLESLFYVLIWVCYHYSGPDRIRPNNEYLSSKPEDDPICKWFNNADRNLEQACEFKADQMRDESRFRNELLPALSDYFYDLRPCLLNIRQLMFGRGEQKITPGEMVKALAEGISHLDKKDQSRHAAAEEARRREQKAREEEEAREMVAALKAYWAPKHAAEALVLAASTLTTRASLTRDPRKRARKSAEAKTLEQQSQPAWKGQSVIADQTAAKSRLDASPSNTKRKAVEFDDASSSDSCETHRTKRPRTRSPSRATSVSTGGAYWDNRAYEEHMRLQRQYAEQQAEEAHRTSEVRAGKKRMFVEDDYLYGPAPSPKRSRTSESAGIRGTAYAVAPPQEADYSRSSYERTRVPSPPSPTRFTTPAPTRTVSGIRGRRASTPFPGMHDSDSGEGSEFSEDESESKKRKRVEEDEGDEEEPRTPPKKTKISQKVAEKAEPLLDVGASQPHWTRARMARGS